MNGPKNTAAIAPQETDRIVTITAGFKNAKIMESKMKNALPIRTSEVSFLSSAFLLMNPL